MNKFFTLIAFLFLVFISVSKAQIPNSGFESYLSDGRLKNWNPALVIISVTIDSNGVALIDSTSSNSFYSISTDAHSGNYALELHNIINYTKNRVFNGGISIGNDTDSYASFSNQFSINQQPNELSFYCKYFPIGNDSFYASMDIFDSLGNRIGQASMALGGAINNYQKQSAAINYYASGIAQLAMLNLSIGKSGTPAHYGTRIILDDFSLQRTTGISNINKQEIDCAVFPNPADNNIQLITPSKINSIEIRNIKGELVRVENYDNNKPIINIKNITPGNYFIVIKSDENITTKKLIIQH